LQVHWAAVVDSGDAPLHASSGTPETWPEAPLAGLISSAQVVDTGSDWVPEGWRRSGIALAAAPVGADGPVLLLGRSGGPQFRPAEVARLGYIAGIISTVLK